MSHPLSPAPLTLPLQDHYLKSLPRAAPAPWELGLAQAASPVVPEPWVTWRKLPARLRQDQSLGEEATPPGSWPSRAAGTGASGRQGGVTDCGKQCAGAAWLLLSGPCGTCWWTHPARLGRHQGRPDCTERLPTRGHRSFSAIPLHLWGSLPCSLLSSRDCHTHSAAGSSVRCAPPGRVRGPSEDCRGAQCLRVAGARVPVPALGLQAGRGPTSYCSPGGFLPSVSFLCGRGEGHCLQAGP